MAVLPEANLGSIIGRIARNRLFVEHGIDQKFPGPLNGTGGLGARGAISPVTRRIVTPTFRPTGGRTDIGFGPGLPDPIMFQPLPGAIVGGQPPAGPSGLGATACNLLSGTARDFCLAALSFLPGGRPEAPLVADPGGCPAGMVRFRDTCVDLTALPPGGDPAFTPTGGFATVGAFGLPALSPTGVSRIVRKCGRGMVLGIDNLCYPKAVLTGRSKFRKWRRPVRPPISRRDVVAIKRAAGARDRVKELAKEVGLTVGAKRPAPKRHSQKHN